MLEKRRESFDVGEARLLHGGAVYPYSWGESHAPAGVPRVRAKEEREACVGPCVAPPRDEPREEPLLVRGVRRRISHHHHQGAGRIEAERRKIASNASRGLGAWKMSLCGQPVTTIRSKGTSW